MSRPTTKTMVCTVCGGLVALELRVGERGRWWSTDGYDHDVESADAVDSAEPDVWVAQCRVRP